MPRAVAVLLSLVLAACGGTGVESHGGSAERTPAPTVRPPQNATPRPTLRSTPPPTPPPAASPQAGAAPLGATTTARIVDVVDGDTIKVEIEGAVYTVRYIGIDTPETVHPSQPVGWMGPEASAANAALVGGHDVVLERDVSETDRFGRLLRYVWLAQGSGWLLVNHELVRRGFATSSSYPPDVRYQELFRAAEAEARNAGLGLWGATPPPAATPPPSAPIVGNCDPSYPGVCIPPYPPDLDCGDITFRRFAVVPPDPHGFDGDHDGVGCESG